MASGTTPSILECLIRDHVISDQALTVSGRVAFEAKTIPYCYKYNAWYGQRPDRVPMFVPCDYDPRRSVSAAITGVAAMGGLADGRMPRRDSPPA